MADFPTKTQIQASGVLNTQQKVYVGNMLDATRQLPGAYAQAELTIASGLVTPTGALHTVDTESDAAADDLDNAAVDNLPAGSLLILSCANAARVVTVKHGSGGSGQFLLVGDADLALDNEDIHLALKRVGTDWVEAGRFNSFATNAQALAGSNATLPLNAANLAAVLGALNATLTAAPASDHTSYGLHASLTAGESLVFGNAVYRKSDGKCWKADADAASTMPAIALAVASASADAACKCLLYGIARDDSWSWTVGGVIYAGTDAGALTQTAPSGSGDQVQIVGLALTATVILWAPGLVTAEVS